jgi:hypothetical protein
MMATVPKKTHLIHNDREGYARCGKPLDMTGPLKVDIAEVDCRNCRDLGFGRRALVTRAGIPMGFAGRLH